MDREDRQSSEWFDNKELFLMLQELKLEMQAMSSELKQTRVIIKSYNGLREEVGENKKEVASICQRVAAMEQRSIGRSSVGKGIREWGGWIISVILFLFTLFKVL